MTISDLIHVLYKTFGADAARLIENYEEMLKSLGIKLFQNMMEEIDAKEK